MQSVPYDPEKAAQDELVRAPSISAANDTSVDGSQVRWQAVPGQELMFAALSNRAIHPEVSQEHLIGSVIVVHPPRLSGTVSV